MPVRPPPDRLRWGSLDHRPGARTLVMGIVNATPDSFSDGARYLARDAAVAQARRLAAEGADIVDIGGESTRPGAAPVDEEEEIRRVLPVLEALRGTLAVPVSVDTMKAGVARPALAAGAAVVNDVWGLQGDPAMAGVVAEAGAGVVVMHNRVGIDADADMVEEVVRFLDRSVGVALAAGIAEERIAVDPGIGFGKTLAQNLALVASIGRLRGLGFPVLVGLSRKSFIGRLTGRALDERLFGTLGANLAALAGGADILRVHDVAPHVDAARVADAILRGPVDEAGA